MLLDFLWDSGLATGVDRVTAVLSGNDRREPADHVTVTPEHWLEAGILIGRKIVHLQNRRAGYG